MRDPDNRHVLDSRPSLGLPPKPMRLVIAISFVVLYLVALIRPLAPVLEYYARHDYFATVLCINKDKPQMHCNGQCVLMQKLKAMQKETAPSGPLPKVNFDDYPVSETLQAQASIKSFPFLQQDFCSFVFLQYASDFDKGFFHPPPFRLV